MTITAATAKNTYTGTGVQVDFDYTFKIQDQTQILVELEDSSGTVTTQTLTTHYTVSGAGTDGGGTITFVSAPSATDTVILTLNIPLSQATDYVENDPFPAANHENALDKLTLIAQQLDEQVSRSVKTDSSSSITNLTIPVQTNAYLQWNSSATALLASILSGGGALTQVAEDTTPQLGADLDANGKTIRFIDATGIEDDDGNEQLIFQKTASAVNQFDITNAATGNDPDIAATGDDTNIDFKLSGKGTGGVDLGGDISLADTKAIKDSNGNELIKFSQTASAVNHLNITNAATGNNPKLTSTGDDTNVFTTMRCKGTGTVNLKGTSTNSGTIQLNEDTDNGTNSISLKAPEAVSTSYTLTLPSADGSADQLLKTDGSGNLSFTAPTAGTMTFISSAAASASSSVEFTSSIDSSYETYVVYYYNVVPATDDTELYLRLSTDGGSSYLNTNYIAIAEGRTGGSVSRAALTTAAHMHSWGGGYGVDSGDSNAGTSGYAYISNPSSTTEHKVTWGAGGSIAGGSTAQVMTNYCSIQTGSTSAVDALEFTMSSGNITSGTFLLYGIKNS